jgi:hypothetical protein
MTAELHILEENALTPAPSVQNGHLSIGRTQWNTVVCCLKADDSTEVVTSSTFYFIYGLFNGAVSNSDCTAPNDDMIYENEQGWIWKEAVMT